MAFGKKTLSEGLQRRKIEGFRFFEVRNIEADMVEHEADPPKARITAAAVSAPEKFCWPVTRLPSRTANARHSPAST